MWGGGRGQVFLGVSESLSLLFILGEGWKIDHVKGTDVSDWLTKLYPGSGEKWEEGKS